MASNVGVRSNSFQHYQVKNRYCTTTKQYLVDLSTKFSLFAVITKVENKFCPHTVVIIYKMYKPNISPVIKYLHIKGILI